MATYTIVSSTKFPLDPGEINAGTPIDVSDGDIFIVDSTADADVVFAAAGGIPADFEVVFNTTNANAFKIAAGADLDPSITIADNADLSGVDIDAKLADSLTMDIGDNVSLGKLDGSDFGADIITIGNGFTTTAVWKTTGGADSITVGDNASFANISTGLGDDTLIFGDGATVNDIDTEEGNDTIFFGDDLVANKIVGGADDDTITTGLNHSFSEVDGGAGTDTYYTQVLGGTLKGIENTILVCYAPGTQIDTPTGRRAIETLRPGDMVLTADNGPRPIRWVHSGSHPLEEVRLEDKPVLIRAGALGTDLPDRDLVVSPQHRILVGGFRQLTAFFRTESFVPAKSLTGLPGIRYMRVKKDITWVHFACDRHEVVVANGCLPESLLLGPMVVNGLPAPERQAVTQIFGSAPTSDAALNGPSARDCLSVCDVRRRISKCADVKRSHKAGFSESRTGARTHHVAVPKSGLRPASMAMQGLVSVAG